MPRWPSAFVSLSALFLVLWIPQSPLAQSQVANSFLSPSTSSEAPGWIGSYGPNGRFKADSKHVCSITKHMVAHQRPAEVPGWFDLRDPNGVVVENLAPPHRSAKPLRPKSRAAGTLESIVAFAYGRDPLLNEPLHLALDSKQRLIVVDPRIPAVHVLTGEASFRIAGGPNHRLQSPHSVAADADDNIYVGDRKTGLIQVFNSAGAYLRSLGMFRDEPIFQEPTAIALDRENRRLFVLDTPVNELLVLDLEGNIIRRIGGHRHLGGVNFDLPNEIALRGSTIAVLDSLGTRLHIFDREGKLVHVFQIGQWSRRTLPHEMGLGLDSAGNVYVSNGEPGIRIYSPAGKLVGRLPNCDRATPGLWIDPSNRMYIADPSIGRVNVFQLSSAAPQDGTAAAADSQ